MLSLLRSPRWIAATIVAVVAVITFVNLGLWQLRRLEERREQNALITERTAAEPVDSAELAAGDADDLAYRRARLTGTYLTEDELLLSTRASQGRPGHHVLTPLRTPEGVIVVDRGWVPLEERATPVASALPPSGEVTVEGLLMPSVESNRHGTFDGEPGELEFVSQVDLDVLSDALGEIAPVWLLASDQTPPQPGVLPVPGEQPSLDEGSHLSYAVQWFIFATVVAVGFPLLLRRVHRERTEAVRGQAEPSEPKTPVEPTRPAR